MFTAYCLPIVFLLLVGPIAVDIYLGLRQSLRPLFWVVWAILLFFTGLFSAYYFSDFFPGPGCLLSAGTFPMVIFSYLWARSRWKKQQHNEANGQRLPRGLVAAAIFPIIIPFVAMGFPAPATRPTGALPSLQLLRWMPIMPITAITRLIWIPSSPNISLRLRKRFAIYLPRFAGMHGMRWTLDI